MDPLTLPKICVVAVDVGIPGFRGASIHVLEASKILAKNGHEVHVICRRYSTDLPAHEILDGIHIHRIYRGIIAPVPFSSYSGKKQFPETQNLLGGIVRFLYSIYLRSIYLLFTSLYVTSIVKKHNLDIILERETSMGCGALASVFSGRPLLLQINGPIYSNISVKQASKIFAYPIIREELIEWGVPRDKIVELFAAVDIERFKPDSRLRQKTRDSYGLGDDPVVGYVGIFAAWHGIQELIEASQIVVREIPSAKFLLVGPYHHEWEKQVEGKPISDSMLFIGPIPHRQVPACINASDVLIAPFNPERSDLTKRVEFPFIPFKILEYMSCRKPVISTYVGSIPQVIKNQETGILVHPGDSKALAEEIVHLLSNPSIGKMMGEKARAIVIKKYSWNNYYKMLIEVFQEVLEQLQE
jgi:glycosyltransferase involved in cell wall biosynthesis